MLKWIRKSFELEIINSLSSLSSLTRSPSFYSHRPSLSFSFISHAMPPDHRPLPCSWHWPPSPTNFFVPLPLHLSFSPFSLYLMWLPLLEIREESSNTIIHMFFYLFFLSCSFHVVIIAIPWLPLPPSQERRTIDYPWLSSKGPSSLFPFSLSLLPFLRLTAIIQLCLAKPSFN